MVEPPIALRSQGRIVHMRLHRPGAALLLSVLMSAACSATPATTPPSEATASPNRTAASPTAARPTADPCAAALERLNLFVGRLAPDLAAVRPLVVSSRFDSPTTVKAVRNASATLRAFDGIADVVGLCPQASSIGASLGDLTQAAERAQVDALDGSIHDAARVRSGAVRLFELLGPLLEIDSSAKQLAEERDLAFVATEVPDEARQPLGKLPPLPVKTARATATPRAPVATRPASDASVALPKLSVEIAGASGIRYMGFSGDTPNELLSSMKAAARDRCSRHSGGACVHLDMDPDFSFVQDPNSGSCTLTGVDWNRSFVVYMPRWTAPSKVPAPLLKWWRKVLDHIAVHEGEHIRIQNRHLAALKKELVGAPCDQAQSLIDEHMARAVRDQAAFDRAEAGWQAPAYP
jgi:predicted secreted Zn-dependent protease